MSNKIAGARRKLSRVYDLHFLDGPMLLPPKEDVFGTTSSAAGTNSKNQEKGVEGTEQDREQEQQYGWYLRDKVTNKANSEQVKEAFEYIIRETSGQSYDSIIGFSQGGTLATALAISGVVPGIKAIVTAGAPMSQEVFDVAKEFFTNRSDDIVVDGYGIPKLHMAGETDNMIPVESTRDLCDFGGNGELIIHEKGHMFPTSSKYVKHMMTFLETNLFEGEGIEVDR